MSRLTQWVEDHAIPRPDIRNNGYKRCIDKLAHYEDLEEQGRLIELPCTVGDTVYEVQKIRKRIQEYTVTYVNYDNHSLYYGWRVKDGKGIYSNLNGFNEFAIGKTVFLNREAAEAKLNKMEGAE